MIVNSHRRRSHGIWPAGQAFVGLQAVELVAGGLELFAGSRFGLHCRGTVPNFVPTLTPQRRETSGRLGTRSRLPASQNFIQRLCLPKMSRRGRVLPDGRQHNSKSSYAPKGCTWVRIPPSPPDYLQKGLTRDASRSTWPRPYSMPHRSPSRRSFSFTSRRSEEGRGPKSRLIRRLSIARL